MNDLTISWLFLIATTITIICIRESRISRLFFIYFHKILLGEYQPNHSWIFSCNSAFFGYPVISRIYLIIEQRDNFMLNSVDTGYDCLH
jgi:hypothetical protein